MDKGRRLPLNMEMEDLLRTIDHMYDELVIYDHDYNVVYNNHACLRHFSRTPEQMIDKNYFDFTDGNWWEPSILPIVYKEKKAFAVKQKTCTGVELLTIAIPIFGEDNAIKYVVMNVRNEVSENDLYNPSFIENEKTLMPDENFICASEAIIPVLKTIQKISAVNINTLFSGESGTGKTMLAKYLHSISDRKDEAFVSINCATIPEPLMESELFGYTKGAFTGAKTEGKKGLFEIADKGILFLDEVTELSPTAQAKLLQVLQSGEFLPIGGTQNVKVDVRIVAATNKVLKELVESGAFRQDLYYRLNVVEISIPPLRLRKQDILPLVNHFLNKLNKKYNTSRYFTDEVLHVFTEYPWKGNIRELKHLVERLVVTSDTIAITLNMLPNQLYSDSSSNDGGNESIHASTFYGEAYDYNSETVNNAFTYDDIMAKCEEKLIVNTYKVHNSSRKLAKHLSISQSKANRLIAKYIRSDFEEI